MKRLLNRIIINPTNGCWEWQGCIRSKKTGYGCMGFNGKVVDTHIISYRMYIGEIEKGLCVCHKCDNRICCNPFHLFKGTKKDNTNNCINKGRYPFLKRDTAKPHPSLEYYRKGCRCNECKQLKALAVIKYKRNKQEQNGF